MKGNGFKIFAVVAFFLVRAMYGSDPISMRSYGMVYWGGFQTFVGPIVGAIVFNYLETYAVGHTVYWQMVLGIVLVVLVLALPAGIVGTTNRLLFRRSA